MKKLLVTIAAVLISGSAHAYSVGVPNGCAAQSVCTISGNMGGIVSTYESAGDAIRHGHHELVIDGFCGSSCMTMADRARPHACITPNATFGFHQTNYGRPIPLSRDLHEWAMAHGGFPPFGGKINIMPNEAAQQFWPLCSSVIVHHGEVGVYR